MLRLSIIIPFYNVEKYIAECLDSVFDQDIPLEEYEVICVNDGSPDHSREIVLDYMKRYPNLRLVEHDHNRKLGAARNTGRSVAKGTYIWNVDSDDKIAPNCLGEMLKVCEEKDLDVLRFEAISFSINGTTSHPSNIWKEGAVTSGVDFWHQQGLAHISHIACVWKMVIRKVYLDENAIYSPEINMNEDTPYTLKTLLLAPRIMTTNNIYYHYRVNEQSLTYEREKRPCPDIIFEDSIISTRAIYAVAQLTTDARIKQTILGVARYVFLTDMERTKQLDKQGRIELRKLYKNERKNLHFLGEVLTRKQKLNFVLFLLTGFIR